MSALQFANLIRIIKAHQPHSIKEDEWNLILVLRARRSKEQHR